MRHQLKHRTLALFMGIMGLGASAQAQIGDKGVYFNHNAGTYWNSLANRDFGKLSGYSSAERGRLSITGGKQLKCRMLKNKVFDGGLGAQAPLQRSKEYTLEFMVKFPKGFDWRAGGKLWGLGGGKVYTGGRRASAGDGWSFRVMWHRWNSVNGGKPYLDPYVYYKDQPGTYGHGFNKRYTIRDNTWYRVWLRAKMNTGSSHNGVIHMKVNNKTVLQNNSFRWVTQNSGREVDALILNAFRGGGSNAYKSSRDGEILFDNIRLDKR